MEVEQVLTKLRPYQLEAVEFLQTHPRALHFDDMGLGKTVTTLTATELANTGHNLILCPVNALYVWEEELDKWFGEKAILYRGTHKQRCGIWDRFLDNPDIRYMITTYGMFKEIMGATMLSLGLGRFKDTTNKYGWDTLIADEIHTSAAGLLNHKTQSFQLIEPAARDIPYVRLLTGTPIRQGVTDTFAPLNIMNKKVYPSYWGFVNRFCNVFETPFGKDIDRRPRDVEQFRNAMQQFMIRRMKKEVLHDLPGKQRQPIFCDMSKKQTKAYMDLLSDMFTLDGDNIVIAPNALTLRMRLRQLLVSPRMLGIDDTGSALTTIADMSKDLLEVDKPVAIFTPFRQALPHIKEALTTKIKSGVKIYELHGQLGDKEFARQWKGFQENPSKQKILLCVIKSGAAFHATEATTAFFLGYEWDFNLNNQAEDRLVRLGQKDFVNVYYMMHKGTVDEDIAAKLNAKKDASDWIVGTEEQYTLLLERFKANR